MSDSHDELFGEFREFLDALQPDDFAESLAEDAIGEIMARQRLRTLVEAAIAHIGDLNRRLDEAGFGLDGWEDDDA